MQVLISFTLDTTIEDQAELEKALEESCPMAITDNRFTVSTERWEVKSNKGG